MDIPTETLKKITESLEKKMDPESLKFSYASHLRHTLAKDEFTATAHDKFLSLAYTIRDRLMERWIKTQQTYHQQPCKRVYYLSLEFLMGRTLGNAILNLGLEKEIETSMSELGIALEDIREIESDAGLGNGGLGRLAACFLDSMATLQIPCHGYGIRYEYGIFKQSLSNGYQQENPDTWLRLGNPWEIERPEFSFEVQFNGHVHCEKDRNGNMRFKWVDTDKVLAVPFDTPIPGYQNDTVNTLRLWSSKSTDDFDFTYFNEGDYIRAVEAKVIGENISKVLYPNDNNLSGKELRIKQQYFFVSASLQDILRRFKQHTADLSRIPDHIAIQLNDTHPAIAIAEFMHLLLDQENLPWKEAFNITLNTFAYTNHTLLPEALETWPVSMYEKILPRHMQIIYEINHEFLKEVSIRFPGDIDKLKSMSIIEEEPEKKIRMAYLSIVCCHSTNGVAKLHTELLKEKLVRNFYEFYPLRFNNKTNGVTQRRWLKKCNPLLSEFITRKTSDKWVTNLDQLKQLSSLQDDPSVLSELAAIKLKNKQLFSNFARKEWGISIDPASLFDVQIKRIHEYKRQLMLALYAIHAYHQIKQNPNADVVPRTILIGGKAAPGYFQAKLIIKLINSIAEVVNSDRSIKDKLKVYFLPNYRVSLAEKIIPASDLSEQISTAGKEASGTGNMKFALNGSLIIGTMDGANIEIREEVGDDNFFIFGLLAHQISEWVENGYQPGEVIRQSEDLQTVLNLIDCGFFSLEHADLFRPITHELRTHDTYFLMADFADYVKTQQKVSNLYKNEQAWQKKCLLNIAHMGYFSSDRTIREYCDQIWHVKPVPVSFSKK